MGWDVYFDGRSACRRRASTWLAQPLVRPVLRLPIELEWPAKPPATARDAPKWLARMARPHGVVSFEVDEQAITLKGQLSEDGVRSYFAVALAVAERLAAENGSGRIELVSAGKGDDFGRAIVASRKTLTVVPLDDIDEATARLIGPRSRRRPPASFIASSESLRRTTISCARSSQRRPDWTRAHCSARSGPLPTSVISWPPRSSDLPTRGPCCGDRGHLRPRDRARWSAEWSTSSHKRRMMGGSVMRQRSTAP